MTRLLTAPRLAGALLAGALLLAADLRAQPVASWYGAGFEARAMADGCPFRRHALTAASRAHPLGTRLRLTNTANGRRVVVIVRDRGPYVAGRALDLSEAAAVRLGYRASGLARVRIEPLGMTRLHHCRHRRVMP